MSLGERHDPPAPRVQPTDDHAASYQPQGEVPSPPPTSSPPPRKHDEESPANWQVGDDVLAPWEPMFLYAGTIKDIKRDEAHGDQALIDYDNGSEAWIFLYQLCPLEFHQGQEVECRRGHGANYVPGEVAELADDQLRVRCDDGTSEWVTYGSVRVPCIENGPGVLGVGAKWLSPPPETSGSGIPSWAIWIGISVLLAFVRIACREMGRN